MMKKKILQISFDAMVQEDVEYLKAKTTSNFNRIMGDPASVGSVKSIYPSITYPAHFAIASGCNPGKSGFYENFYSPFNQQGKKGWILESQDCPVEDFFAVAKRAGMTTASVFWPSMANNPNIDWLINECFPSSEEDVRVIFANQGANEETLGVIEKAKRYLPKDVKSGHECPSKENTHDEFLTECLCLLIKEHQPDFAVVHNSFIDTVRHRYGVFHERVTEALDYVDEWLGKMAEALMDAGVYEDTNIVIVSDHGQMSYTRAVKPNLMLRHGGFLTANEEGKLDTWQAYAVSCSMSAHVYLKDREDEKLYEEVYNYLKGFAVDGVWGIKEVLTEREARERYGLYGEFSFVLEGDGYTIFWESVREPLISDVAVEDYREARAAHGYKPELGPQPVFCAKGPDFVQGAFIPNGNIIDIAPTLAVIMGEGMPDAEGKAFTELLR